MNPQRLSMKTMYYGGENTCLGVRELNLSSMAICVPPKKSLYFSGLKFTYKIKLVCFHPKRGILWPDICGPGISDEEFE